MFRAKTKKPRLPLSLPGMKRLRGYRNKIRGYDKPWAMGVLPMHYSNYFYSMGLFLSRGFLLPQKDFLMKSFTAGSAVVPQQFPEQSEWGALQNPLTPS